MRTEEMEKEAKLFNKENECFIHIQRCADQPYAQIVSGDPKVLLQAVFNLMTELETDYNLKFKDQIKIVKWAHRNISPDRVVES